MRHHIFTARIMDDMKVHDYEVGTNEFDFYLAGETLFSGDLPTVPPSDLLTAVIAASIPFPCYKYNTSLSYSRTSMHKLMCTK